MASGRKQTSAIRGRKIAKQLKNRSKQSKSKLRRLEAEGYVLNVQKLSA